MATIGDVAKKAGVSTTLVSRYLNGIKGVGPASKEKIESAIRELNYIPDESARMLVRRRGGAASTSPEAVKVPEPLPPAIALLCEDIDFQLLSALYLGAKIAVRADDQYRQYRVMLFCIPSGSDRNADEDDTLFYLTRAAKGIYAIGCSDMLVEKLRALALPVISVRAADHARQLYRSTNDFKNDCAQLETDSGARMRRLCEKIAQNDAVLTEETIAHTLIVSDEPPTDHNPLGRSLQSHLL